MEKVYKARVIAVFKRGDGCIEISFIYYGSYNLNIHTDKISTASKRYVKAEKIRVGDEVCASEENQDKIYEFVKHSWLMRLYVSTIRAAKQNLRAF